MPFTKPTNGVTTDWPQQIGRLIDLAEGPALRNFIRNGDFQIAQRGTSFAGITTDQYTLDGLVSGAGGTNTVTQQTFAVGQTDVPGNPRTFARIQRTVAAGADNSVCSFRIEHPEYLSGKTVTASFWAKVASGTKALVFDFSSSGVTSAVDTADNAASVTTTWTQFKATVSLPAMTAATASAYLILRIREAASFGTFTFDIADAQLELGNEATYFARLNYGEQMRWCQRYLPGFQSTGTTAAIPGGGPAASTTTVHAVVPFGVRARAAVTGVAVSAGSHVTVNDGVTTTAATGVTFNYASADAANVIVTVAAGLTQFRPYTTYFNNSSGYLLFTGAEL